MKIRLANRNPSEPLALPATALTVWPSPLLHHLVAPVSVLAFFGSLGFLLGMSAKQPAEKQIQGGLSRSILLVWEWVELNNWLILGIAFRTESLFRSASIYLACADTVTVR